MQSVLFRYMSAGLNQDSEIPVWRSLSVDELLYDEPDKKEPQLPGGYIELLKDCDEYETRILSYVLKMSKKTLRDSSDFRKMIEEMESKKIKGKQRKIQKKPLP